MARIRVSGRKEKTKKEIHSKLSKRGLDRSMSIERDHQLIKFIRNQKRNAFEKRDKGNGQN